MKRGDHIKVFRGIHSHHGIYLGGGRVIHYTGEVWEKITGERDFSVRCDSLATFRGSGTVKVVTHKNPESPEIVVKRAESRLGETRYSLALNNCEHFATKCVTGVARSKQVERAAVVGTVTGVGAAPTVAVGIGVAPVVAVAAAGAVVANAEPKTRKAAAKSTAGAAVAAGAASVATGAAVAALGVATAPVVAPVALVASALGFGLPKLTKKGQKTRKLKARNKR